MIVIDQRKVDHSQKHEETYKSSDHIEIRMDPITKSPNDVLIRAQVEIE